MTKKSSPFPARFGVIIFLLLSLFLGYYLRTPTPEIEVMPQEKVFQDTSKAKAFTQGIYRVSRVLDGDTIDLEDGTRIRYEGIDAPEKNEAYGLSSTKLNQELVGGRDVLVVPTENQTDPYGRVLAFVYVAGVFVNEKMIEEGYARALVIKGQKPEKYDQLKAAQDFARSRHLGIWLDK